MSGAPERAEGTFGERRSELSRERQAKTSLELGQFRDDDVGGLLQCAGLGAGDADTALGQSAITRRVSNEQKYGQTG